MVGIFNTFLGYFISLILFEFFNKYINLVYILIIANFISISTSFINYKFFVFKSKALWINEYFKSYLIYGWNIIFGITFSWLLVEKMHIHFWESQLFLIIMSTIFSYFGHRFFTFRNFFGIKNEKEN